MGSEPDLPTLQRALRDALHARAGVRVALLFGSRARGTARVGSDVDLGVEANDNVDLLELGVYLGQTLNLTVDVVSVGPDAASIPLLLEVLRDGIVVFEDHPGAEASWRARVLTALDTDYPWYVKLRDSYLKRLASEGFERGQP